MTGSQVWHRLTEHLAANPQLLRRLNTATSSSLLRTVQNNAQLSKITRNTLKNQLSDQIMMSRMHHFSTLRVGQFSQEEARQLRKTSKMHYESVLKRLYGAELAHMSSDEDQKARRHTDDVIATMYNAMYPSDLPYKNVKYNLMCVLSEISADKFAVGNRKVPVAPGPNTKKQNHKLAAVATVGLLAAGGVYAARHYKTKGNNGKRRIYKSKL